MTLPRLYAVLDAGVADRHGWTVADLGKAFLDGGARLLQFRAKDLDSGAFLAAADSLTAAARSYDARVIINDRADVARLAGAAGVHVGQHDLAPAAVRRVLGDTALVGLSTHTEAQIEAAARERIDYMAIGPVFGTTTKHTGYHALGLDRVRGAAACSPHPLVAIGGITLETARDVVESGAQAVAVISDLLAGGDPAARVRDYLQRLGGW